MTTVSNEPIDVNKLLDKPYSELTDAEVAELMANRESPMDWPR